MTTTNDETVLGGRRDPVAALVRDVGVDLSGRDVERLLWGVAVATLVADLVATHVGLQAGLTEGNPLVRQAIAAGGPVGHLLAKGGALCLAGLVRWRLTGPRSVIPLGLAVTWAGAAILNATLIL